MLEAGGGTRQGHVHKWSNAGAPLTVLSGYRVPGVPGAPRPGGKEITPGASTAGSQWTSFLFWGCSVESSDVNWKKKKSGGIKIICQSEMRDFSAMAFITDHVNSLIDQWFPGKRMFLNPVFSHVNISL